MRIRGIETWSPAWLEAEIAAGGRFVFYEYCVSLLLVTLRRPSDVFLLKAGERGLVRGLPYTLLTLVLGWWGIPWGLAYTPLALFTNLKGGRDVTLEVCALLWETAPEGGSAIKGSGAFFRVPDSYSDGP